MILAEDGRARGLDEQKIVSDAQWFIRGPVALRVMPCP